MPRALLSVSDKTGLVAFARELSALGYEIVSTGGTARALREGGLDVTGVSEVTGFPEVMGGRVKTLHPKVHGGILADRDNPEHVAAMREHAIEAIDIVVINLYPFEETIAGGCTHEEAVEQIDIGGPAMVRASAKNHAHVTVVTDPAQYEDVVEELRANGGRTTRELRAALAAEAFAMTSTYDGAIADYLADAGTDEVSDGPAWPEVVSIDMDLVTALRYGENPHQAAALYVDPHAEGPSLATARQLAGKELSYNNLADAASAMGLADDFAQVSPGRVGAVVVKHTNACGAAVAGSVGDAVRAAYSGDPLAAYGGILAVNHAIDEATAAFLSEGQKFFEVVLAPGFAGDAAGLLSERWKNVRLLEVGEWASERLEPDVAVKLIPGGALLQERDAAVADAGAWTHGAGPGPEGGSLEAAAVVWTIAKHLTSNAIAIGGADPEVAGAVRLFGGGCGQVDRVSACRLALAKAGELARGAVAASDAFFPFDDGPRLLIDGGVSVLVHPGGSKRDGDTFKVCEERGVTCLLTGVRHFRH